MTDATPPGPPPGLPGPPPPPPPPGSIPPSPTPPAGSPTHRSKGRRVPLWALAVTAVVALVIGVAIGAGDEDDEQVTTAASPDRDDLDAAQQRIDELEGLLAEATGGDTAPVSAADPPADQQDDDASVGDPGEDDDDASVGDRGSRDNPVPAGETAGVDDWEITVLGVDWDATAAITQENMFNDPPAPGRRFVMIELSATYQGPDDSASLGFGTSFELLGDSNVAYTRSDGCGVTPGGLDSFRDVFQGGTISGNECWSVLEEDLDSLLLSVEPSMTFSRTTRTFFALPASTG